MPIDAPHLAEPKVEYSHRIVDGEGHERVAEGSARTELRSGDTLVVRRRPLMAPAERKAILRRLLAETENRRAPDPLPEGYESAAEALARVRERYDR